LIEDKEAPFAILHEIFVEFDGFSYLKNEVQNVISALNKCYDKFYLLTDEKFLKLYLDFFKEFVSSYAKRNF